MEMLGKILGGIAGKRMAEHSGKMGGAKGALLDRVLATYGDDADFTEMAKVIEADAGLDAER
jgi:hypothetical protein